MKESAAARYLGISVSALRQARMNGPRRNRIGSPPFIRLGRAIVYDMRDLDAWLAEHRVGDRSIP